MVSGEPPLTQHRQDQGAGGGLQETEQRTHTHHHPKTNPVERVTSFKFPRRSHHRGSHMVCSHRCSAEEGTSASLLLRRLRKLERAPESSGPSTPARWRASCRLQSPPGLETARWQPQGSAKGRAELPATLLEVSFPPSRISTPGGVQGKPGGLSKDSSHPSHRLLSLLPSGRRFRSIRSRTSRLRDSFFPQAIRLMKQSE